MLRPYVFCVTAAVFLMSAAAAGGPFPALSDHPLVPHAEPAADRIDEPLCEVPEDDHRTHEDVYGAGDAAFAVRVGDHVIPYSVFGVYAMPGEKLDIATVLSETPGSYSIESSAGTVARLAEGRWHWKAPREPGLYRIEICDSAVESSIRLNAFVLTPFTADHHALNGYRIGTYERVPLNGNPVYRPPSGFVELRPGNRDVKVSPHFTLGQFVAKQESAYPKYLLLREPLLLKLEMLLAEVNKIGAGANSLHIMSGYRTPHYNRAIGNTTTYSRHLYGGAADIFVDADGDGYMDDLTGEGRVDLEDARLLASIIDQNTGTDSYDPFVGGLGVYPANSVHGPFIHVDVRGHRARW